MTILFVRNVGWTTWGRKSTIQSFQFLFKAWPKKNPLKNYSSLTDYESKTTALYDMLIGLKLNLCLFPYSFAHGCRKVQNNNTFFYSYDFIPTIRSSFYIHTRLLEIILQTERISNWIFNKYLMIIWGLKNKIGWNNIKSII